MNIFHIIQRLQGIWFQKDTLCHGISQKQLKTKQNRIREHLLGFLEQNYVKQKFSKPSSLFKQNFEFKAVDITLKRLQK